MNEEGTVRIALTKGQFAIVDAADAPELMKYRWTAMINYGGSFRVACRVATGRRGGKTIYLHRHIMNCPEGAEIDHINGDCLDNRRCNLRICTHAENTKNRRKYRDAKTSRYKGVSFHNREQKWVARIFSNGKEIHIGEFCSEEEAAHAYDKSAIQHHGEFARTNFVNNQPNPYLYV